MTLSRKLRHQARMDRLVQERRRPDVILRIPVKPLVAGADIAAGQRVKIRDGQVVPANGPRPNDREWWYQAGYNAGYDEGHRVAEAQRRAEAIHDR